MTFGLAVPALHELDASTVIINIMINTSTVILHTVLYDDNIVALTWMGGRAPSVYYLLRL